ncbi:hypothetical protein I6H96_02665 [Brucella anthropi]|uniref:Uncharacterized protein n=1 Tax=Brucella anthropi (strain ATCC 49188 / DSM 6882 / CCUG 24695 / JCM 21032 / LMG 3331 / NBRC 15819 / NCTC 12168 / Alc 37) TaxID=439375 RepID=A6WZ50_BRUA4|nr:hypothetical protein Oant_1538 [Brucella anthropi ATCC 49188]NKC48141.1 hypothetical protein [Brucella anthropi ATCC 49188]QQC25783.1 hypothetical protein I6H96_02665 [Brucella anthropi]SUA65444.1 Uncharacterised protein [Brucella anthropi]
MRIPEIRRRLLEKSKKYDDPELAVLAKELCRRTSANRSAVKSSPMTPTLARQIRKYKTGNPDASHVEIASHFNVNPGRVSEALHGKRQ